MSVGYLLANFQDAWERYLPGTKKPVTPFKPVTADMETDSGTEGDVTSVTGSGVDRDDDELEVVATI